MRKTIFNLVCSCVVTLAAAMLAQPAKAQVQMVVATGAEAPGTTVPLVGSVVNDVGTSVSGARVRLFPFRPGLRAGSMNDSQVQQDVSTSADGSFKMAVRQSMGQYLMVEAQGYVPEIVDIFQMSSMRVRGAQDSGTTLVRNVTLHAARTVKGIVADESGVPLSGVSVRALPAMRIGSQYDDFSERLAEATTDGDGMFALYNVPDKGLLLQFTAPGFASAAVKTEGDAPVAVNLQRGATVTGKVYMEDTRAPAGGTTLSLYTRSAPQPENPNAARPTEIRWNQIAYSGESGTFAFRNVPPGEYILDVPGNQNNQQTLDVWNPGQQSYKIITVSADAEQVPVELLVYKGYTLRGFVMESGTSNTVSNARIWLTSSWPNRWAESDANGFYEFREVFNNSEPPRVALTATAKGYVLLPDSRFESANSTVTLNCSLPTSTTLVDYNISMVRQQNATGLVVDAATSEPVRGAKVTLIYDAWYTPQNEGQKASITGDDGRFELATMPGRAFRVRAEAPDYSISVSDSIPYSTKGDINVRMERAASLDGVVVDPKNAPVEGAGISVTFQISGGYDNFGNNSSYRETIPVETKSDGEGKFRLPSLPTKGTLEIAAYKMGFARSEPVFKALKAGDKGESISLQLREAKHLAGRVLDPAGQPLARVSINFQSQGTSGGGHAYSDENGQYRITTLPDAPVHVSISHGKYGNEWFYDVAVGRDGVDFQYGKGDKDGQERATRENRKERSKTGVTLYGTVVDYRTGEPVKDFQVYCSRGLKAEKDADLPGEFTVKGIQIANVYQMLRIVAPGYAVYDSGGLYIPAGQPEVRKTFKLGPGGTITGRAVEKGTKKPVVGVTIGLTDAQPGGGVEGGANAVEKVEPVTSDAEGKFTMPGIGQGRKIVEYTPPAGTAFVKMSQPVDVVYNEVTDLGDVEFGTGGTIKGQLVRYPGEEPIPNAQIKCSGGQKDTTTDADGRFEFTNLVNGLYTVEAPQYGANSWIGVEQLETKDLILEVGTGQLVGNVTRAGAPYPCSVKVQKIGYGQSVARWADADNSGRFIIGNLAPGRWNVQLTSKQDSAYAISDFIEMPKTGESVEKTFTFPSGGLRITVTDAAGKAVPRATVQIRKEAGAAAPLQGQPLIKVTDASGSVSYDGLAPGNYSAMATGDAGERGDKTGIAVSNDQNAQATLALSAGQGGTLISSALNMVNGKPVPTAWCYLFKEDGTMFDHSKQRDEMGIVMIEGIPAGTYRVQVSALGFSVSVETVTIQAGQTSRIDDVLYPSGALRWALKTGSGAPVVGASCTLSPSDASSIEEPRQGSSNTDGVFVVRGLMPGPYVATARYNGKTISKPVMIYAANATDEVSWLE